MRVIKYITLLAVIILIAALFTCRRNETPVIRVERDTVMTFRIDTVFFYVRDTVVIEIPTIVEKEVPIPPDSSLFFARTYSDTVPSSTAGIDLFYLAHVHGRLQDITLGFSGEIPVETRTETTTITETSYIDPSGWYVSGSYHTRSGPGAGLQYLRRRWSYQYHYYPSGSAHQASISFRIRP